MKRVLVLALFAVSLPLAAQVCDVTYTLDVETAAGNDVTSSAATVYGLPMADVLDNHDRGLRVLKVLAAQQDKGGPYTVEVGEFRVCDGGAKTKVEDGSAFVKGVTLQGANKVARAALKEQSGITKRGEDRAAKGQKEGWNHSKAKKVKRDDLGKKVKD